MPLMVCAGVLVMKSLAEVPLSAEKAALAKEMPGAGVYGELCSLGSYVRPLFGVDGMR